jgi:DNA-nicking Smr family endonuclease
LDGTTNNFICQSLKKTPPVIDTKDSSALVQTQIYLATSMSISVSGRLDLNGHTKSDATERLKECIIDGYILGWHNIHVLVGYSEEIKQTVVDLLKSPTGRYIISYAQAPTQMGGPNDWILYFK